MASAKDSVVHKHFRLDSQKLRRAQKLLNAKTETETVERVLDFVISEQERNRLVAKAHDKFLRSGIVIRDVYGLVAEPRQDG